MLPAFEAWQSTVELFSISILLPQLRPLPLVACHHILTQQAKHIGRVNAMPAKPSGLSVRAKPKSAAETRQVKPRYTSESRAKQEHTEVDTHFVFTSMLVSFYS